MAEYSSDNDLVITGYAAWTPLGNERQTFKRLLNGESGFTNLRDPGQILEGISEEVTEAEVGGILPSDFDPFTDPGYRDEDGKVLAEYNKLNVSRHRVVQIGTDVGVRAARHAGLFISKGGRATLELDPSQIDPDRLGVFMATGIGGAIEVVKTHERILAKKYVPATITKRTLPERISSVLSKEIGAHGPLIPFLGACAASNIPPVVAAWAIHQGEADIVIVGGAEAAIIPGIFAEFDGLTALDRTKDPALASRPFDKTRSGFVPSEGGGAYVIEKRKTAEARGATIRGEFIGWGLASDAYHDTAPDPEGTHAARAITQAMNGVERYLDNDKGAEGYICAHGTATWDGDPAEIKALGKVPGIDRERVVVSSAKAMIGHIIGGAAAAEAVICLMLLDPENDNDLVVPSVHMDSPDDFTKGWMMSPGEAIRLTNLRWALNNSFGFGGFDYVTAYGRPR